MFSEDLDVMCEDCGNRDKCEECTKVSSKPQKDYWANICEINRQQTEKGIKKYGYPLEENPIVGVPAWIRYMEEELIDGLKYAEKIKDEYDKYRWHNLRHDPYDPDVLPDLGKKVIIKTDESDDSYYVATLRSYTHSDMDLYFDLDFCAYTLNCVEAWRYMETFEVEE